MLQNNYILYKCCSFEFSTNHEKKNASLFAQKKIKQHNCCSNIEDQIKIFDWFLKDHVTLKAGVIAAENSALL